MELEWADKTFQVARRPALKHGHPLIGRKCAVCGDFFEAGETLAALASVKGRRRTVLLYAHWECLIGEEAG